MSELLSALEAMRATDVHALPEASLLSLAEELLQAKKLLDGRLAGVLQAVDAREVTVAECGPQTRSWLTEEHQIGSGEARKRMWVARNLPFYPLVAAALAAGDIAHDNAHLAMTCLAPLPAPWRDAAQAELVSFARDHDPGLLGALCRELRVRTGADDDADAAELHKYASRWMKLSSTFDGMTAITGMLDPTSAATVAAALNAVIARDTGAEDDRSTGQRTADALTELAKLALGYADLPDTGGERPTVVVTIPLAELRDGARPGMLSAATVSGHTISPGTARMLACDAGIIPAVLGSNSEVLNLGRRQRSFTTAQRRAARLRTAAAPGLAARLPLTPATCTTSSSGLGTTVTPVSTTACTSAASTTGSFTTAPGASDATAPAGSRSEEPEQRCHPSDGWAPPGRQLGAKPSHDQWGTPRPCGTTESGGSYAITSSTAHCM